LYLLLTVADFAATVFLVTNGYADEANPFINGFTALFSSFALGLAIYKTAVTISLVFLLRQVNRQSPAASRRLLFFANAVMLGISGWHIACLHAVKVI
jgi:hypothetical protein